MTCKVPLVDVKLYHCNKLSSWFLVDQWNWSWPPGWCWAKSWRRLAWPPDRHFALASLGSEWTPLSSSSAPPPSFASFTHNCKALLARPSLSNRVYTLDWQTRQPFWGSTYYVSVWWLFIEFIFILLMIIKMLRYNQSIIIDLFERWEFFIFCIVTLYKSACFWKNNTREQVVDARFVTNRFVTHCGQFVTVPRPYGGWMIHRRDDSPPQLF